jgi:hypothetical protein
VRARRKMSKHSLRYKTKIQRKIMRERVKKYRDKRGEEIVAKQMKH